MECRDESELGQLSLCKHEVHRKGCRPIKARKINPQLVPTLFFPYQQQQSHPESLAHPSFTINTLHPKLIIICHFHRLNFISSKPHYLKLLFSQKAEKNLQIIAQQLKVSFEQQKFLGCPQLGRKTTAVCQCRGRRGLSDNYLQNHVTC